MNNKMTEQDAANYLQISRSTLWRLRKDSKLPYLKIGARRVYEQEQLDAYINSCRINYIAKTNTNVGLDFEDDYK